MNSPYVTSDTPSAAEVPSAGDKDAGVFYPGESIKYPTGFVVAREARNEAWDGKWKRERVLSALTTERLKVIQQIADGHIDPRGLCVDYLRRLAEFNGEALNDQP